MPRSSREQKAACVVKEWHMTPRFQVTDSGGIGLNQNVVGLVKLVNLRNRTGEERRRQTLCDKHDTKFVSKHFPLNFTFL